MARKMEKALRFGTVHEVSEIEAGQQALLKELSKPMEPGMSDAKIKLVQRMYSCFTFVETRQICDGRGPFLNAFESRKDRSVLAANFRALHLISMSVPAPWPGCTRKSHRLCTSCAVSRRGPEVRLTKSGEFTGRGNDATAVWAWLAERPWIYIQNPKTCCDEFPWKAELARSLTVSLSPLEKVQHFKESDAASCGHGSAAHSRSHQVRPFL